MAADISAWQCYFIVKSSYVPPDESYPYACNTSDLIDNYIFKILDFNTPTINSHQFQNALKRFHKRDPKVEGFITDGRGLWFDIATLYETTNHTYSYSQFEFHKLSVIKFFETNTDDATVGVDFNKFISALRKY